MGILFLKVKLWRNIFMAFGFLNQGNSWELMAEYLPHIYAVSCAVVS